jgi:alkanesulfonate monooxygenase SsuD/methylene tetrahydromethanopterin reductase-like flavin-dependent oxidoreductase (luciferase family)
MKIGIGLPNPVPGTPGRLLVDWAVRAEERGFVGLATIDRIAYPSHDSLTTLAAAAGATSRIGLFTNILLAPLYRPALLAKAVASLDQLSGGRFTLGLAAGGRADDYTAAGADFHTRGRTLDQLLDFLPRVWRGEPIGQTDKPICPPPVHGRIPVLVGGTSDQAVRRAATFGDGWAAGGIPPDQVARMVKAVRAAWQQAGRDGEPRLTALTYFSLGEEATSASQAYLRDYYGFLGPWADRIAEGALRSEATIRDVVRAYQDAGVTELYFDPTVASLEQVDRLADVAL